MKALKILDVGFGNISAVQKFLKKQSLAGVFVTENLDGLRDDDIIVLAGVGNFGEAVQKLNRSNLVNSIRSHYLSGGKIIGICLGLQLFFRSSQESPDAEGLDLIEGSVIRNLSGRSFIGWSTLCETPYPIGLEVTDRFYFSHSFHVTPMNVNSVLAVCEATSYPAILRTENLLGMQFHPEKSQKNGSKLLQNVIAKFVEEIN